MSEQMNGSGEPADAPALGAGPGNGAPASENGSLGGGNPLERLPAAVANNLWSWLLLELAAREGVELNLTEVCEQRFGVDRRCASQAAIALQRRGYIELWKSPKDGAQWCRVTDSGLRAVGPISRTLLNVEDKWRSGTGTAIDNGRCFGGPGPKSKEKKPGG